MNNLRIFYNISKDYWVELSHSSEVIRFHKMDISKLEYYRDKTVNGGFLNSISDFDCVAKKKYHIALFNKILCFNEKRVWKYNSIITEERICSITNICNSFRLYHKEKLLKKIFVNNDCSIEQALQEVSEYIFCEHYSLWLYNDITNYFTLLSSSFETKSTFKLPKGNFIEDECKYEDFDYSGENDILKNIKSLNRIKIELTSPTNKGKNPSFLIVNFFSKHIGYSLRKETLLLIKEILNLKFSKTHFPKIIALTKIVTELNEKFHIGELDKYLQECVSTITKEFDWEATSIFIKNDYDELKLKALYHFGDNNSIDSVIYTKEDASITYNIFQNNKIECIYDIDSHPQNSHKFDETTQNKPQNWIGIPIKVPNIDSIGVLRVKNKLDSQKKVIDFNRFDIIILINLAENIAYQYHNEQKFIEEEEAKQNKQKELQKQENENKELTEFIRTFRHEIKTPLTLITTASTRLKNRICDEYKIKEDKIPKKIKEMETVI